MASPVTGLDFVAVPSTDWPRSRAFYVDTLGLRPDEHAQAEFWAGEQCFGIWEPARFGMEFAPQRNGHIAFAVEDVSTARAEIVTSTAAAISRAIGSARRATMRSRT